MAGLCLSCGAPLGVPVRGVITCSYCGRTAVVEGPRRHVPPPQVPRHDRDAAAAKPARGHVLAYAVTAGMTALVLVGGGVAAFVQTEVATQNAEQAVARATRISVQPKATVEPTRTPSAAKPPMPTLPSQITTPTSGKDTETDATRDAKTRRPAEPAGEVVSKAEAETRLKPQILACMREAGVHYLITRLGSGSKPRNPLPSLDFTEETWVDYRRVPKFASTPLGRCIAKAAKGVRTSAFGGNYIYFGLRNDSTPDPLAGVPDGIDHDAAERLLGEQHARARACDTRDPAHARMGESVPIHVRVRGIDGTVIGVDVLYVEPRTTYAKCIKAVYMGLKLPRFRGLEKTVTYHLPP